MKALYKLAALTALVAAPVVSFAQSSQPITRAQVNAQLAQLEKAGYNPAGEDPEYPLDLQRAEKIIASQGGSPLLASDATIARQANTNTAARADN